MAEFTDFIVAEWKVLSAAPLTFFVGWLILTGAAYTFLRKFLLDQKEATIETLHERISWTEEQRNSYKNRIEEFERSAAAIENTSPHELKEKALELVSEIRDFLGRARRELDRIHSQEWHERNSVSEEEKKKRWANFTEQLTRQSSQSILEYDRRFKVAAIVMRDQLLANLPDYSVEESPSLHYEHPTNPIGMGMVADDLEKMANSI